ncbi:MAG: hypothetical protein ACO1SV_06850 [Fimbriimonas sp.]
MLGAGLFSKDVFVLLNGARSASLDNKSRDKAGQDGEAEREPEIAEGDDKQDEEERPDGEPDTCRLATGLRPERRYDVRGRGCGGSEIRTKDRIFAIDLRKGNALLAGTIAAMRDRGSRRWHLNDGMRPVIGALSHRK